MRTEKFAFCVTCALNDEPEHNQTLNKMDHVYIREKRGWEETRRVALLGEFVYPGEYVLLPNETLGQLVRRAGGFSESAYFDAAVFSRNSVKELERKRNEEYIRTLESNIARLSAEMATNDRVQEAQYLLNHQIRLLERLREIKPVGRVVINLSEPRSYENFMLENGDTLFVPKTMNTVSVMGEVFNPSTFQHDPRHPRSRHYVSLSGGTNENANRRKVYIVRANGGVVSGSRREIRNYSLSPGDAVIVPQKIRYVSGYRVFTETIDAIYKVAMTAAVVITIAR
jgi:protein involved in polysaccharide export with SLBB domain